jgi:spermidine/putrescine transport system ATP-binding protein
VPEQQRRDVNDPARSGAGRDSSDLRIVGVTKRFGGFTAVDDLTLTIPAGSFFALLGPSGCGKTTTLRMVAGLEEPTAGRILLGEDDVTGLRPYKRPVNTVFQSYALFPHLSIAENVAFGLRRRRVKQVDRQVEEMLELVELGGFGRRKPGQLSGGQQQRVALARALINHPQVLLLDEPLGALDLKLRRQMQLELKRIQTEVGITFVHVTHDQEEAMTMADTIAVMNAGRVEQLGSPEQLYEHPTTRYVANFLGQSNCLDGAVEEVRGDTTVLADEGCRLTVPGRHGGPRSRLSVGVRPEKTVAIPVDEHPDASLANHVPGAVTDVAFTGLSTQYLVRTPWGQEISVFEQNAGGGRRIAEGERVVVAWRPEHTFPLDVVDTPPAQETPSGSTALAGARA